MGYAWPGNIRELATVIDRAAILGDGKLLEVAKSLGVPALPAGKGRRRRSRAAPASFAEPENPRGCRPLDDIIRRHIESSLPRPGAALKVTHGAAKLLKINPHTLRGRMRKLKIDWKQFRD